MNFKKLLRRLLWLVLGVFVLMNIVAAFHAYKFTHWNPDMVRQKNAKNLTTGQKLSMALFGVSNGRPMAAQVPSRPFQTIHLKGEKNLECWLLTTDSAAKGTVILCHGYGGEKSTMLDKAEVFLQLGYNTLLVDFMGSGGSEGNNTTIGYKEAEQVKTCVDYIAGLGEKHIVLMGTSMGAVAIMKALGDYPLPVQCSIIECPFGTMMQTVEARFRLMHAPVFPMARLLMFWGSVENGFNAFSHNPVEYAKDINCPTLLLYGEKDDKVSRAETNEIFKNIPAKKRLETYALSAHENYLLKYKEKWIRDVTNFLVENNN